MRALLLRHFVAITGVIALACYVWVYAGILTEPPIRSDGYSYYVYLPAWILHHDPSLDAVARDCCGGEFPAFTAITRWPGTGRWVNPHPIGVAILTSPFFIVAHALTRWSNFPPDGFSFYYQYVCGLAGLAAMLAGLSLLRVQLTRHFTTGVSLAALVTVTWGTNLFHYGVFDSSFSHAFSFSLIAALLLLTDDWWARPTRRKSLLLALVAALIVLTRHLNALFLFSIPAYGIASTSWRDAATAMWRRRVEVALMLLVSALAVLPQLLIYEHATGHWLVSPYGQVGRFDFGSSHIVSVFFGVQKGLFFWSPVLLFAVAGAVLDRGWARRFALAAGFIFAADGVLIASWSDWQLGASFGHRGFTDGLAFAGIFLAAFFQWTAARPRLANAVSVITTLLVLLSIKQMLQYWLGVLPMADTTWDQYRDLFLRFR
jgi:hypothetical protein